jgi:CubicO group peptidase (beta-lactamase class C family)
MERARAIERRRFLSALGGAAALAACTPSETLLTSNHGIVPAALTGDGLQGAVQALLDSYISTARTGGMQHVAVVAGIVHPKLAHPRVLVSGSAVSADDHAKRITLSGDTPFEIGSITKTFTSWVFGSQAKSYDGLLGDYLKLPLPSGILNIPIEAIVSYSSGFPTDDVSPVWWVNFIDPTSLNDLIQTLKGQPLPQCAAGKVYSYSNFAWGLLGLAAVGARIRHSPGERWKNAIAGLCSHLGMSTRTFPAYDGVAAEIPAGYLNGQLCPTSYSYYRSEWKTLFGDGDLVSSGNDMLKWLLYNMGQQFKDFALLKKQQKPAWSWNLEEPGSASGTTACTAFQSLSKPTNTAIAWFRPNVGPAPGNALLSKDGGLHGYTSWMGFVPWTGTGMPSEIGCFVLTNNTMHSANHPSPATQLGLLVMETLLSKTR